MVLLWVLGGHPWEAQHLFAVPAHLGDSHLLVCSGFLLCAQHCGRNWTDPYAIPLPPRVALGAEGTSTQWKASAKADELGCGETRGRAPGSGCTGSRGRQPGSGHWEYVRMFLLMIFQTTIRSQQQPAPLQLVFDRQTQNMCCWGTWKGVQHC